MLHPHKKHINNTEEIEEEDTENPPMATTMPTTSTATITMTTTHSMSMDTQAATTTPTTSTSPSTSTTKQEDSTMDTNEEPQVPNITREARAKTA